MTTPSITQLYWITIACERFGNIASAWTGFFGCRLTFDLLFCIERNWECGLMIWWNLISSQIFFVPWIGSATQLRKEEFLHWIVCTSLPQAALRSVVSGTSASLVPARWVPSRCFWAYFWCALVTGAMKPLLNLLLLFLQFLIEFFHSLARVHEKISSR